LSSKGLGFVTKPPFGVSLAAVDLNTKSRKILNGGNFTGMVDLGSIKLKVVNCGTINGVYTVKDIIKN
jgi:hypothetical protein